ncbi:MAG: spore photoproduct lyase family protein [Arcobacteraceae bacterium]
MQNIIEKYKFTFSQINILKNIEKDFKMWNDKSINKEIPELYFEKYKDKQLTTKIFEFYVSIHNSLKNTLNDYADFKEVKYETRKFSFNQIEKKGIGLGACPVASEGTRCCNLLTLDAVESCGFDCSYCSIQSFYNQNKVGIDKNFKEKLGNLDLNPNERYHIGTGQSSDSLMWGNKDGILDALFEFARSNPNVILEFKTKSNNIQYFLENDVPKNIICTWSLNTQTIIDNEEHLTASLDQRIGSARALADKGVLVGFHFHPIVQYKNYLDEYKVVYDRLQKEFTTDEVVLISMGTLTFIKPVMKQLREREMKTKILQMPFETINGKQSYSLETKQEMFQHAYNCFESWHGKVYFYLCMEAHSLWKDVFGYEYKNNDEMEQAMKTSYWGKITNNPFH